MPSTRHIIFGTAGHVDHGKSMLVLALTGTDPDRLAEEKAREMTIDLGFAFLSLPGIAGAVAIVDVPGHEMFLRNMVAGATGIDAAMLVIACDEGVMPQTIEHLDVLRCLRISEGVIVLTKADKSPDLIPAVTEEARELVRGTFLEKARAIPVSSVTGEGLPALKEELARIAARVQARSAEGIFRLPIDRVFTLKGVGTVVTGTVISGSLKTGETVACLPQNSALRVRALQVHNQPAAEVFAGQRAAINLADASKEDLERGNVLAAPGSLAPTLMADARLELSLRGEKKPLAQRARVRIHHGTSELMARVVLLDRESLQAGESALVQLRFESPLVAAAGDPFVVRSYSPMFVIGGGSVVDPHPPKRRKAAGAEDVAKRESSPVADVILDALDRAGARGVEFARLRIHCGIGDDALRSALAGMKTEALAADGRRDVWFSAGALREMQAAITARLARLHAEEPLRPFAALNQVSAGAAPTPESRECFRLALDGLRERGEVVAAGERLRLAIHQPQWVGRFAAAREKLLAQSRESGLAVPAVAEWAARVGLAEPDCRRALDALAEAGELVLLAPGIYVHPESFNVACDRVKEFLAKNGRMNIAQARDLLGASRKYLLPFLEELDRRRVTARQGDFRVPGH
jgi:selenocysteine-specific elongation factor